MNSDQNQELSHSSLFYSFIGYHENAHIACAAAAAIARGRQLTVTAHGLHASPACYKLPHFFMNFLYL